MPEYRGDTKNTKTYTEDERRTALELAATIGVRQAARHLDVPRQTIYKWVDKYPQLWSDLRAGDPAAHRKGFSYRLEDLADRYTAAEHELLDKLEDGAITAKDAKEAAALIKALGSSRQAAVAGSRSISGEAEVVEHRIDFPQLEKAMEALLGAAPTPTPLPVPNEAIHED